jgi:hypothetical protein
MNRLFSFLLLFLLFVFYYNPKGLAQSNIDWAVEQLKVLSPGEYNVLQIYDQIPDTVSVRTSNGTLFGNKTVSTLKFMIGGGRYECLGNIETDVHEINHLITHYYPFEYCRINNIIDKWKRMYYFYLDESFDTILFSNTDFFPSRNLLSEIPDSNRTFRFNTYLKGNLLTQSDGLLGLLDEFNAYHHSMTVTWNLKNGYLSATGDKVKGYIEWMKSFSTLVQAYYEFRFFILEYLRYARLQEPYVYEQIKNEPGLMIVFNQITERYKTQLSYYEKELTEGGKEYWQKFGYKAYLNTKRGFYFIGKDGSATGFRVKLEDKEKLLPILLSHSYDEVVSELKIIL